MASLMSIEDSWGGMDMSQKVMSYFYCLSTQIFFRNPDWSGHLRLHFMIIKYYGFLGHSVSGNNFILFNCPLSIVPISSLDLKVQYRHSVSFRN